MKKIIDVLKVVVLVELVILLFMCIVWMFYGEIGALNVVNWTGVN